MSTTELSITAFEHSDVKVGREPTAFALSNDEADLLEAIGKARPGFAQRRHESIHFGQFCGVVNIGQRVLEVLPKIEIASSPAGSRDVLLRMLRHSGISPFEYLTAGQSTRDAPLLEPFIAAFLDATAAIVRGGLLHRYEPVKENLMVVRGTVDLTRQFRDNWNRPDLVACRYDELSPDHLLNRLVKRALRVVRPWLRSGSLERRWIELLSAFDDVADEPFAASAADQIVWDRKAIRYRGVLEWVGIILRLHAPSLQAGDHESSALLFDMNRLFESVVLNVLSEHFGPSRLTVHASGRTRPLARTPRGTMLNLRPDFVITRRESIVGIADAKWKRVTVSDGYVAPAREDLFQMYAYANSFGCDRLALIYPWTTSLRDLARETMLSLDRASGDSVELVAVCVDVASEGLPIMLGGRRLFARDAEIVSA